MTLKERICTQSAVLLLMAAIEVERILRDGEKVDENLEAIEAINGQRAEVRRKWQNLGELEDLFYASYIHDYAQNLFKIQLQTK